MPTIFDVSSNQGTINWKLAAPRHFGAYIKGTEGADYVDHGLLHNALAARQTGLHVGFYHYARPDNNAPDIEARHFFRTTGEPHKGDLVPALDLETKGHAHATDPVSWARVFNHTYHGLSGIWPLFYSYSAFIHEFAAAKPIGGGLWLADYGPDDGHQHPASVPAPWKRLRLHQYTQKGTVAGIAGHVDLSYASEPLVVR